MANRWGSKQGSLFAEAACGLLGITVAIVGLYAVVAIARVALRYLA